MIFAELDKDHPDLSQIEEWRSELEKLQLKDSSEADVRTSAPEAVEDLVIIQEDKMDAKAAGIMPNSESVVVPATPQERTGGLDARALGLLSGKEKVFQSLSLEDIQNCLETLTYQGDDGTVHTINGKAALVHPALTIEDEEHVINLGGNRSEICKAARGLALNLAGALSDDGTYVMGSTGTRHIVSGGECYTLIEAEIHGFDGVTKSTKRLPCQGINRYKSGGRNKAPIKLDSEDTRCKHMWAIEWELGYFVILDTINDNGKPNFIMERVAVEMANECGDANARKWAEAQVASWEANTDVKVARQDAVQTALNHARNIGAVNPLTGELPLNEAILAYKVGETGLTVQEFIQKNVNGRWFRMNYTMPLLSGDIKYSRKFSNIPRMLKGMAYELAAVAAQGQPGQKLQVDSITVL